MCELESLRVSCTEAMTDIFLCLLDRGFFMKSSEISEGGDKEYQAEDFVAADVQVTCPI